MDIRLTHPWDRTEPHNSVEMECAHHQGDRIQYRILSVSHFEMRNESGSEIENSLITNYCGKTLIMYMYIYYKKIPRQLHISNTYIQCSRNTIQHKSKTLTTKVSRDLVSFLRHCSRHGLF